MQDTTRRPLTKQSVINRIADYLSSIGLKKGDTVAVNIENRPELLATVVACAKLGVCAALINTSQRGKVLTHSFNLVKPKAAVIGAELTDAIDEVRQDLELDDDRFYCFADQDTLENAGTYCKKKRRLVLCSGLQLLFAASAKLNQLP